MERKILYLVLFAFVFAWASLTSDSDDLKDTKVVVLFGFGIALLLGAFMMGCAIKDLFFLAPSSHYCPLMIPGYAFIIYGFAILGKRLWVWMSTGK